MAEHDRKNIRGAYADYVRDAVNKGDLPKEDAETYKNGPKQTKYSFFMGGDSNFKQHTKP